MPSPSIPIRNGLCTFVASALLSTGTAFAQEATFNTRQLTPDTALEASRARIERNHVMQDKIAAGSTLFEQLHGDEQLRKVSAVVSDGPWNKA